MIPAPFEYIAPATLGDAVRALASYGEEARLLAGGHSLIPLMKLRLARPKVVIDLGRIEGLSGCREEGSAIAIGALTTHYQVETSELLKARCPLLPLTARAIGDVQVRNWGTVGGSLAHADPAADLPAAILALGAELCLLSTDGERRVKADEFFLGLMSTALRSHEILTEIRLPVSPEGFGAAYLKMAQKASGFAVVGVAVWLRLKGAVCEDLGIGVTGLDSRPFRAREVEEGLRGKTVTRDLIDQACFEVTAGTQPLDDIHASAEFRAHLARVYTARALEEAIRRARGPS